MTPASPGSEARACVGAMRKHRDRCQAGIAYIFHANYNQQMRISQANANYNVNTYESYRDRQKILLSVDAFALVSLPSTDISIKHSLFRLLLVDRLSIQGMWEI